MSEDEIDHNLYMENERREHTGEETFYTELSLRKKVIDTLKNGTLSCLPRDDGFADTTPALNLLTGTSFHDENLLCLKIHQKQNDFPTAEYVTKKMIDNANKDYPELFLHQDQNMNYVLINWQELNIQTNEWERRRAALFNVDQTTNPEKMKAWSEQIKQEKYQKRLDFMKEQYGPDYQPPKLEQKESGLIIDCSSTEPEKYLGQYFAAVFIEGKFKVTLEQATEFVQKLGKSLYKLEENGIPDPFKFSKICGKAKEYGKEIIFELKTIQKKESFEKNDTEFDIKNNLNVINAGGYNEYHIETAQKTGYVQGVCESVLAFNTDENRKIMSEAAMSLLSKKILSEMHVTKDMAQKFANPETYKALEQCVFAPKQEQQLEQTQSQARSF